MMMSADVPRMPLSFLLADPMTVSLPTFKSLQGNEKTALLPTPKSMQVNEKKQNEARRPWEKEEKKKDMVDMRRPWDVREDEAKIIQVPAKRGQDAGQRGEESKYICTFYVNIQKYKEFKVAGRIIGRRGEHMKHISQCCPNSKLRLRGLGSGHLEGEAKKELNAPMHIIVSSLCPEEYELAKQEVCSLLRSVYRKYNAMFKETVTVSLKQHPKNGNMLQPNKKHHGAAAAAAGGAAAIKSVAPWNDKACNKAVRTNDVPFGFHDDNEQHDVEDDDICRSV